MNVLIRSCEPYGSVCAPPSKSIAHRLIVCAALADGESRLENIAMSEDIRATADCAAAIGARCDYKDGTLTVKGIGPSLPAAHDILRCRECGSTLRFFLPLCMLSADGGTLTGSERLLSRPMSVYEDICKSNGIFYRADGISVSVGGGLRNGTFIIFAKIKNEYGKGKSKSVPLKNNRYGIKERITRGARRVQTTRNR